MAKGEKRMTNAGWVTLVCPFLSQKVLCPHTTGKRKHVRTSKTTTKESERETPVLLPHARSTFTFSRKTKATKGTHSIHEIKRSFTFDPKQNNNKLHISRNFHRPKDHGHSEGIPEKKVPKV
jgi:hypothetical protein